MRSYRWLPPRLSHGVVASFFEKNENFIIRSYRMNKYLLTLQQITKKSYKV